MKWAWLHDYAPAARMATSAAAWRDYEPQARWIESIFEEMDPLLDLGPALHGIYRGPHHHRFRCEGCLSDRPLTQLRPYMFCNLCYSLLQPLHRWHDSALFQQYGQPELRFTQATIREHHTACGLRLAMNWSGAAYIHEKWIVKFIRAAEHLRHRSDDTWVTAALGATPGTTALRQFVQQNIAHERACRVTAFTLLENDQDAMMLAGLDKHSATRLMTILTEAGIGNVIFPPSPEILGLVWERIDSTEITPDKIPLEHPRLRAALSHQITFTEQQWNDLDVTNLKRRHVIQTEHGWFRPVEDGTYIVTDRQLFKFVFYAQEMAHEFERIEKLRAHYPGTFGWPPSPELAKFMSVYRRGQKELAARKTLRNRASMHQTMLRAVDIGPDELLYLPASGLLTAKKISSARRV